MGVRQEKLGEGCGKGGADRCEATAPSRTGEGRTRDLSDWELPADGHRGSLKATDKDRTRSGWHLIKIIL